MNIQRPDSFEFTFPSLPHSLSKKDLFMLNMPHHPIYISHPFSKNLTQLIFFIILAFSDIFAVYCPHPP